MPNTNSHPKHFLPLATISMTTMPWNPFLVCEIDVSPNGGPSSCCGMTKKGTRCKNSIKPEVTKIGHHSLETLAREPFDLSILQPKLCAIAREFLCARWHRHRQAEQVGQQWFEAAVRNQARVPYDSVIASQPVALNPGQRQTLSVSRRHPASDNTDRSPPRGLRQDPPVPLSATSEPAQAINQDVNNIHCVFCLTDDEDHANERVILRCRQCTSLSHLSCAEEWLERRDTGFGTSCCVW